MTTKFDANPVPPAVLFAYDVVRNGVVLSGNARSRAESIVWNYLRDINVCGGPIPAPSALRGEVRGEPQEPKA